MKTYLTILLLLPVFICAQNMVPNPGFEDNTGLPNGYAQFFLSNGWDNVNGNTTGPPWASPDYFHTAGTVGNFFGQIAPFDGDAQMGLGTYHQSLGEWREYISTELTTPMVPGTTYTVEFWLTNGSNGGYQAACNNFGVHFSVGPLSQIQDEPVLVEPQIEITDVIYYDNFWEIHSFTYTADDVYDRVTYGNFRDDASTTVVGGTRCYYFIDGCLIEPDEPVLSLSGDTEICEGESTTLYANGTGNYVWTDPFTGVVISTEDSIIVSPSADVSFDVTDGVTNQSITVTVNALPIIDLGVDTTLCPGESLLLDASLPDASYQWQDMSVNSTFNVDQPGLYTVVVSDMNNCLGSDEINVDYTEEYSFSFPDNQLEFCDIDEYVYPLPLLADGVITCNGSVVIDELVVNESSVLICQAIVEGCVFEDELDIVIGQTPDVYLGNDTTLCDGDLLTIDATLTNVTYDWSTGSDDPIIVVASPDIYSVTISDFDSNCEATFDIQVDYIPFPEVDLGPDIELCDGEITNLNAFFPNAAYTWQDNSTASIYTVTTPGTYYVTTQVGSCLDRDTVIVNYNPNPEIELGSDTLICADASLDLSITQSGASYIWQDGSQGGDYIITEPGQYFASISFIETGCKSSDTINVNTFPLPTLLFGNDTVVCSNERFALRPNIEFADSTIWHNGNRTDEFIPIAPGIFYATSYNRCGQTYDEIDLGFEDCSCSIYIPNAITPDGDGLNDHLQPIFNNCDFFNYRFSVFDRWGRLVFETEDPEESWNGAQKDEQDYYRQANVYVWVMTFEAFIEGQITSSQEMGHITLIR